MCSFFVVLSSLGVHYFFERKMTDFSCWRNFIMFLLYFKLNAVIFYINHNILNPDGVNWSHGKVCKSKMPVNFMR